jgi:predicted nuclease with TOPRIM domain
LKIIESLQKKQGKNQAKKKELGPNLKILKNENSRLKDAIRKKKNLQNGQG